MELNTILCFKIMEINMFIYSWRFLWLFYLVTKNLRKCCINIENGMYELTDIFLAQIICLLNCYLFEEAVLTS